MTHVHITNASNGLFRNKGVLAEQVIARAGDALRYGSLPQESSVTGQEGRMEHFVKTGDSGRAGIPRTAQSLGAMTGGAWAGTQIAYTSPSFYSPLHTATNWQIPTKRREVYQWARFFSQNDPTVKSSLRFYSQFPFHGYDHVISDPIRKEHFDNLKKRLKLESLLPQIAYEYFTMGDVFPFITFQCDNCQGFGVTPDGNICDHQGGRIANVTVMNPDWVDVQINPLMPNDPVINLIPDDTLKQIVWSKKPVEIYEKIPEKLRALIMQQQPIHISNRAITHMKHDEIPYMAYGNSIIAPLFPILAYQDRLRQAQWIVAERHILPIKVCKLGSDTRPASSADIADTQRQLALTANDPNLTLVTHHTFDFSWVGACHTEDTEVMTKRGFLKYWEVNKKDEIATYNSITKKIEYHKYLNKFEYDYNSKKHGKIKTFKGKFIDCEVTPNHKMYAKIRKWNKRKNKYDHKNFELIESKDINEMSKFLGSIEWDGNIPNNLTYKKVNMLKNFKLNEFLKFLGYFLSEGTYTVVNKKRYGISISQNTNSIHYEDILKTSSIIKDPYINYDNRYKNQSANIIINSKEISEYFEKNFGVGCENKHIPNWILNLPKDKLVILMDSLLAGDGNICKSGDSFKYKYTTTSKILADNVQEIVFKLGYSPSTTITKFNNHYKTRYDIYWCENKKYSEHTVKDRNIGEMDYIGKVWCFEVPNHIFITRLNGKLGIHGNSGKVLQLTKEYELIDQALIKGLGVNEALLSGTGPSYCFPQFSRILTDNGFKNLNEFDKEKHLVATLNPDTHKFEWGKATHTHVFDHNSIDGNDNPLIHFNTKNKIDCIVTENHEMYVKQKLGRRISNKYEKVRADKVKDRSKFILKTEGWKGFIPDDIDDLTSGIDLDTFLQLSAYFITEGSYLKYYPKKRMEDGSLSYCHENYNSTCVISRRTVTNRKKVGISFSQSVESEIIDDFIGLKEKLEPYGLNLFNTLYKESFRAGSKRQANYRFSISSIPLAEKFNEYFSEYSYGKKIPNWIKNLPQEYLEKFIYHCVKCDGYERKLKNNKIIFSYTTTSKKLNEDIFEILIKIGKSPRMSTIDYSNKENKRHDQYTLYWSNTDHGDYPKITSQRGNNAFKKMDYKGKVWCVTVPPNNLILVENNGRSIWTGNSQAAIGIESTIKRLKTVQNMIASWICDKIYRTESIIQGFYKKDLSGNQVLDYPEIRWADLNLRDETQKQQLYMQMWDKQLVSTQFIHEKFEIDHETEVERVRMEQAYQMQLGIAPGGGAGSAPGGGGGLGGGFGGGGGGGMKPGGPKGNLPGGQSGPGLPGDANAPNMSGGAAPPGGAGSAPSGPMAAYETQMTHYNQAKEYAPSISRKSRIQEPKMPRVQTPDINIEGQEMLEIPRTGALSLTDIEMALYAKVEEAQKLGHLPLQFLWQQSPEPNDPETSRITADGMFPDIRLLVEADGKQWHSSPEDIQRDQERDSKLMSRGWSILRFTEEEIKYAIEEVIKKIIRTAEDMMGYNQQDTDVKTASKKVFKLGGYDGDLSYKERIDKYKQEELTNKLMMSTNIKKEKTLTKQAESIIEEEIVEIIEETKPEIKVEQVDKMKKEDKPKKTSKANAMTSDQEKVIDEAFLKTSQRFDGDELEKADEIISEDLSEGEEEIAPEQEYLQNLIK